jgi:hypothetical protein
LHNYWFLSGCATTFAYLQKPAHGNKTMNKTYVLLMILGVLSIFISGCTGTAQPEQNVTVIMDKVVLGAPSQLPEGQVGVYYEYSFCDPNPKQTANQCYPKNNSGNPTGSKGPYTFYLGSGVGFPPLGVILNNNGILSGKPTTHGPSKFEVCAKDIGGNFDCKVVNIVIAPAKENKENKTQVKATVSVTSAKCTILETYTGDMISVLKKMGAVYARYYNLKATGMASGPVGTRFILDTKPLVGSAKEKLDCGDWFVDTALGNCMRLNENMSESMNWEYETNAYGEQVNVDPNLQIKIEASVSNKNYDVLAKDDQTTKCPAVTYN